MSKIHLMDEILANKIAAGEVVEKCVSVVKELVENSIDAKASIIKVELKDAGTQLIKVTDNGIGMDEEDSLMAFQRHATSKIIDESDLYRISTLGFRGEALPSIASVSNVTLKTCSKNIGTIVNISGGKVLSVTKGDARIGTIIEIKNLFYNTPARLKHIKSLYSELANITEYMNKIAFSHPNIKFTLTNNDNKILETDGRGDLLKTIKDIYGLEVAKKMYKVKSNLDDYEIEGYISYPSVNRSNKNHMITIVNGRVVKNYDLNRTINDSYHSYKPDNRYPIVVLKINVDPSLIDVNIHPTKMDIKFSKMNELLDEISTMIKNTIGTKNLIPKVTAPVVEKKHYEQFVLDFNKKEEVYEQELFVNEDLTIKEEVEDEKKELEAMYPVGIVHGTYIICQNELGMYLIDQHAAKERINYEIYKEKLGNPKKDSLPLLFPITIEYPSNEFIILKENFEFIRSLNIDINEFGINSIIIKSHPTWLPKGHEEEAIKKILDLIINIEKNFTIEKFNEKLATTLACKMSIKANTNITIEEMERLISDLRKCDNPYNCPHGRPTIIFYSTYELEKLFKRSGFENLV
ncbi:MAG: DNA mismatch repair endonuclease MutL [Tenericutes bacterium]|nr:DNA mismatch repair endonuclease MutL [Mycoplasmatota bacterium]